MARPPKTDAEALLEPFAAPLGDFLDAMENDKGLAANPLDAYRRALSRYLCHLVQLGVARIDAVEQQHVAKLLHALRESGLSPSTMARNLTSIKRCHQYLLLKGVIESNPAELLAPPKLERKLPDVLTVDEISALLQAPDADEPLGQRDRAILEVLYATGLRVSEFSALQRSALLLACLSPMEFPSHTIRFLMSLASPAQAKIDSFSASNQMITISTSKKPRIFSTA